MKRRTYPVVMALALALAAGCDSGTSDDSEGGGPEADCAQQIRAEGTVYTSHGYTEREGTRHAKADRADCDDVGQDAAGSVFSENPSQVVTWAFDGYPAEQVLGVRFDQRTFAVFVAESVPRREAERIYRELDEEVSLPSRPRPITMQTVRRRGSGQLFRPYTGPKPAPFTKAEALARNRVPDDYSLGLWDVGAVHESGSVRWTPVRVIAGERWVEDFRAGCLGGEHCSNKKESGWGRFVSMYDARSGRFVYGYNF